MRYMSAYPGVGACLPGTLRYVIINVIMKMTRWVVVVVVVLAEYYVKQ